MSGAGVRQSAGGRVVDGSDQRRKVVVALLLVDDTARHLQRLARSEAGFEVGTDHVTGERGSGQRLTPVTGDVAYEEPDAAVVQREDVIEVTAGGKALGRSIGDRHPQRAYPVGHDWQERGLERTHVCEQRRALRAQPAV